MFLKCAFVSSCVALCVHSTYSAQPTNVARSASIWANSVISDTTFLHDGKVSDASRWMGTPGNGAVVKFGWETPINIGGIHFYSGGKKDSAVQDLHVQIWKSGWVTVPSAEIANNRSLALSIPFDETIATRTDSLRIVIDKTPKAIARIREICVWERTATGLPVLGTAVTGHSNGIPAKLPEIFVNQLGYDRNKPMRFTAPTLADNTPFQVSLRGSTTPVFQGIIRKNRGDFSAFNATNKSEYVIIAGGITSFPFRIESNLLQRATVQRSIDFMVDARHWVGNVSNTTSGSFGWRDDHQFGWELHVLVPQFLSNPGLYQNMPHQITWKKPIVGKWGALEPWDESAPDIVKMIAWGADVIVTQKLRHEHLKAQLAYFLYAWPWLKKWLPEQNYRVVRDYAFSAWATTSRDRKYPYDESSNHNLFALKRKLGSTKGSLPPGVSILPNLLMYQVAERENRSDSTLYFEAAYKQAKWMVDSLNWNDSLVTKGQRMSEFLTMTGMATFQILYPKRTPPGMVDKIREWGRVVTRRSDDMWDFRRYTDSGSWIPPTWNEPGNVAGLPAAIYSMLDFETDTTQKRRLAEIAQSHFDNMFGRNPTGRTFSYDAPIEIPGVDLGWYSFLKGGIGRLSDVRFVLDGAPKAEHYPYHPDVGDIGWTEGWVQFNIAFNASLAWMTPHDLLLQAQVNSKTTRITFSGPLHLDPTKQESLAVTLQRTAGGTDTLVLHEDAVDGSNFSATLPEGSYHSVSYAAGWFTKSTLIPQTTRAPRTLHPSALQWTKDVQNRNVLSWHLSSPDHVRLRACDVASQCETLLSSPRMNAGLHHITWTPRTGLTLIILETSQKRQTLTVNPWVSPTH